MTAMIPGEQRARRSRQRPLRVHVVDEWGRTRAAGGLGDWVSATAPASVHGVVTVALVSDARMRALNRLYRHQNRATDVLSFPVAPDFALRNPESRSSKPAFLGDVVIASGVARRQAHAAGHSQKVELRVLALHGLLHLLGYDHEDDHGEMRRVERRLRQGGGLGTGLIDRQQERIPAARPVRRSAARQPARSRR